MDTPISSLLDELHRSGAEHDARFDDRLLRLRNVEPETGALLNVLIRAIGASDVLELGTSNGVSTIWLAEAAARVVSIEVDAERSEARANLERAGLADRVELRVEERRRRWRARPTTRSTWSSWTPSGRPTSATGRTSAACCGRAA